MGASGRGERTQIFGERHLIFVTVGTQLAFERLTDAADAWAQQHEDVEVFAQIGPAIRRPKYLASAPMLSPETTASLFRRAHVIVGHAGMGSILTALQFRKPIIVMPRRADLGEHRNDHQVATAKWLCGRTGIYIAHSADQLHELLNRRDGLVSGNEINESADSAFVERLRFEIFGD